MSCFGGQTDGALLAALKILNDTLCTSHPRYGGEPCNCGLVEAMAAAGVKS